MIFIFHDDEEMADESQVCATPARPACEEL